MARKRSLVIMNSATGDSGMEPLGSLRAVTAALANYNIAADGSGPAGLGDRMGTGVFHGPGMIAEVPLMDDPSVNKGEGPDITQILVAVTDEDFAFPVLMRMCRIEKWKMMDPDSGRTFG